MQLKLKGFSLIQLKYMPQHKGDRNNEVNKRVRGLISPFQT